MSLSTQRAIFFVCVLVTGAGCERIDVSRITFHNLDVSPIVAQDSRVRIWQNQNLGQELVGMAVDTSQQIIAPDAVFADSRGFMYVVDSGDFKVKRFDSTGTYVASFGGGPGEAPGEVTAIRSLGFLGDSLMWWLDANQKISYFRLNGSFYRSERLGTQWNARVQRLAITPSGRKYYKFSNGYGSGNYFATDEPGAVALEEEFGRLQRETGWEVDIPLFGWLAPYGENVVYVPDFYPLVMQYASDGNLNYARTTVDYGHVEEPAYTVYAAGRRRIFSQQLTTSVPSVDDGRLFIHAGVAQAIDVYNAQSGDYSYSVKIPRMRWAYVKNERLYLISDEKVSVRAMRYVL